MTSSGWRRNAERVGILATLELRNLPLSERLIDSARLVVGLFVGLSVNEAHGFLWALAAASLASVVFVVLTELVRSRLGRRRGVDPDGS